MTKAERVDMTEQPAQPDPTDAPAAVAPRPGRGRLLLRASMATMALAVVAFAYFTPVWMDKGLTQANENRLRSIAMDTARKIRDNGWNAEQGAAYARRQGMLGDVDADIDVTIGSGGITVRITGEKTSANPFASLTGAAPVHRIEVVHSITD